MSRTFLTATTLGVLLVLTTNMHVPAQSPPEGDVPVDESEFIDDAPGDVSDFVVVDYDSNGDVFAAYIPQVGVLDGMELQAWLFEQFPMEVADQLTALIEGDGADAAMIAELAAIVAGYNDEKGFAVISTTTFDVTNFGTVLDITTASEVADATEVMLLADGFSTSSATAAVRAFMLKKKTGPIGKLGSIFEQQYIYISTTDGDVYYPENGEELQDALEQIENDGDTIDDFIIKGHGSAETIEIGSDGDFLTVANGDVIIGNVDDPNVFIDIGDTLNNVTDANTDISLRGCSTAELAEDLDDALGGDPDVSGAPSPVIGIPWTPWTIGPWVTY